MGQVVDQLQKLIKGAPRNIQEPEQPFMWLAVFPGHDTNSFSCLHLYGSFLCIMLDVSPDARSQLALLFHNWTGFRSPFRLALKATNIIKHQRCTETGTQDKVAEPFKGFYDFWGEELSYEPTWSARLSPELLRQFHQETSVCSELFGDPGRLRGATSRHLAESLVQFSILEASVASPFCTAGCLSNA